MPPARLLTPSQTAGPFVSLGMAWLADASTLSDADPGGDRCRRVVLDGDERPVTDAMLEFWQTEAPGASLLSSDRSGTVLLGLSPRPMVASVGDSEAGSAPRPPGQLQAPHIDVSIFARACCSGSSRGSISADEEANAADPVLAGLESPDLRNRLVAQPSNAHGPGSSDGPPTYWFDIHLQGDRETIFFGPW